MDKGDGTGPGNSVHIQYGYNFENNFIGTGLYGEYDHFENQSSYKKDDFVSANTIIGTIGTKGNSTGNHLHYSFYTTGVNNYSKTTAQILFGKNFERTRMQSITHNDDGSLTYNAKYVYDPTDFYKRNKK